MPAGRRSSCPGTGQGGPGDARRDPAAALLRAVENLKLRCACGVARGDLTEEQIHGLAATIDATATAVERS